MLDAVAGSADQEVLAPFEAALVVQRLPEYQSDVRGTADQASLEHSSDWEQVAEQRTEQGAEGVDDLSELVASQMVDSEPARRRADYVAEPWRR